MNFVTGVEIAFVGPPEQCSRSLTRSLKLGVKISWIIQTRSQDCFRGSPRAVFTIIDQINSSLLKVFSDLVSDLEDCSGEPTKVISTPVTELFTVFSPREWLFGIWINVN